MKKNLLALLLALGSMLSANAQFVTIPDSSFADFLRQNYSGIINFNQLDTTDPAITGTTDLNCMNKGIKSLDGIQYFDALITLNCSGNFLTSVPALPQTLKTLNCGANYITSFAPLPNTLTKLLCGSNYSLGTLPTLPDSLKELYCASDQLNTLPTLPPTIEIINASQNAITSLPGLPSSLRELYVYGNLLQTLPALPTLLSILDVGNNAFTVVPALPPNLHELYIYQNYLTTIDTLPNSLIILSIGYNNLISSIPASFPPNLQQFYAEQNQLTVIPPLPATMEYLWVGVNRLTTLPALPAGLVQLDFSHNQISTFPTLPAQLELLWCRGNLFSQIPAIPNTINSFYCGESMNLTSITNLPPVLSDFYCYSSPFLQCLPHIGTVSNFRLEGTGVTCFPNYGTITTSTPPDINSLYPLCDPSVNTTCASYANLAGRVYTDDNSDCILNGLEAGQANVKQQLFKNGLLEQIAFTVSTGHYSFNTTDTGKYTIVTDTSNALFTSSCPANGILYDTLTITDSVHFGRDFAWHCRPGFNLVAQSVITPDIFRPANFTEVTIHAGDLANFYKSNCAVGISGTVSVTISGPATYASPALTALAPSSVAGNVVTWNVADFGSVNFNTAFGLVVQTDTFAQSGQQVCFTVTVTPFSGDNDTLNNILTHCFAVVNSYDPNDKQVYPIGNIDTTQEWLTYTVRFQNTGNAPAQHIYLMDTLDSNVDASTFQLLGYSHQPNILINEKIVRFNLPYINLPDSNSNEPGSHGYVQYKVKLKEGLAIGTTISNTAYIYFDFNEPVVTNTTLNTISEDVETGISNLYIKDLSLNIYPNPANQQVTVVSSETGGIISLYNTQGKLLSSYTMNGSAQTINVAELPSGIYYVEVKTTTGQTARKKFVKL